MHDERPCVAPDRYSYFELPAEPETGRDVVVGQLRRWYPSGTLDAEARVTIVDDEHPVSPYPNGIYIEGWDIAPHKLPTLSKPETFNFPLTTEQEYGA